MIGYIQVMTNSDDRSTHGLSDEETNGQVSAWERLAELLSEENMLPRFRKLSYEERGRVLDLP